MTTTSPIHKPLAYLLLVLSFAPFAHATTVKVCSEKTLQMMGQITVPSTETHGISYVRTPKSELGAFGIQTFKTPRGGISITDLAKSVGEELAVFNSVKSPNGLITVRDFCIVSLKTLEATPPSSQEVNLEEGEEIILLFSVEPVKLGIDTIIKAVNDHMSNKLPDMGDFTAPKRDFKDETLLENIENHDRDIRARESHKKKALNQNLSNLEAEKYGTDFAFSTMITALNIFIDLDDAGFLVPKATIEDLVLCDSGWKLDTMRGLVNKNTLEEEDRKKAESGQRANLALAFRSLVPKLGFASGRLADDSATFPRKVVKETKNLRELLKIIEELSLKFKATNNQLSVIENQLNVAAKESRRIII